MDNNFYRLVFDSVDGTGTPVTSEIDSNMESELLKIYEQYKVFPQNTNWKLMHINWEKSLS